jgi:branched-chain amino acid transport system substrate-binding protein
VAKAIENGKSDKPADIRANLERITGFAGVGGVFNFSDKDHGGLDENAFEMIVVSGGDWKILN